MRLRCYDCGKPVSTEVPDDTIIRATLHCPECIGEQTAVEATVSSFECDFNCFGFNLLDRDAFERLGPELWLGRKVKLMIEPIVPPETVECKYVPRKGDNE